MTLYLKDPDTGAETLVSRTSITGNHREAPELIQVGKGVHAPPETLSTVDPNERILTPDDDGLRESEVRDVMTELEKDRLKQHENLYRIVKGWGNAIAEVVNNPIICSEDVVEMLKPTLEEIIFIVVGLEKDLDTIRGLALCPGCNGYGSTSDVDGSPYPCPDCNGEGKVKIPGWQ